MTECFVCSGCFEDALTSCPFDGSPLTSTIPGPPVIDGKYLVEQRLGAGGMGVIYRVVHSGLQRRFALKLISARSDSDPSFFARFRAEAEALGNLGHPHIVDVSDFGVDPREEGLPYLVMEYLEGTGLDHYCRLKGAIPPLEAIELLGPIAEAIDYAHEHRILHRDLKPANLFLSRTEDGRQVVKILDFGLARRSGARQRETEEATPFEWAGVEIDPTAQPPQLDGSKPEAEIATSKLMLPAFVVERAQPAPSRASRRFATPLPGATAGGLTEAGMLVGTPGYMAPELLVGGRSGRTTDIYAFGVVIYEVLTGTLPFDGYGYELLLRQTSEDPIPASQNESRRGAPIPTEMDGPLLEILAREPSRRPASAVAAIASLERAWMDAERRAWRARELPRRLLFSIAVALLVALLTPWLWRSQSIVEYENFWTDLRFGTTPKRAPDPRISLILFDDDTMRGDATILSEKPDELGLRLGEVFGAGAKAVAIDMLLAEKWSKSMIFSQFILKNSGAITLAAQSDKRGRIIGADSIGGLTAVALGEEGAQRMFGIVAMEIDSDSLTRRARLFFRDASGKRWPSLAAQGASKLTGSEKHLERGPETFPIDFRIDPARYPSISWLDLPGTLAKNPAMYRDQLVIVGADFTGSGDDFHQIPHRSLAARESSQSNLRRSTTQEEPESVSGPILQALITDTILSGFPVRPVRSWFLYVCTGLVAGLLFFRLMIRKRVSDTFLIVAAAVLAYVVLSFFAFRISGLMLPIAGPLITMGGITLLALVARSRLTPFLAFDQERNKEAP